MAEWSGRSGVTIVCDQLNAAGKAVLTKAIKRAGWQVEQFALARWDDIPAGTRAIVACGDKVLDELTGWKGGKRSSNYTRGYLLPGYTGLPVVPTFDPSKVAMGQMKLLGLVMQDLGVAMQAAVGSRKVCINPKALVEYKVGLQALKDLYNEAASNPELLIAFDLETATSWEEDEDESIEFSRDSEDEMGDQGDDEGAVGVSDSGVEENTGRSLSRDALSIERAGIRTVQFSLHPGTGISCDWGDECRDWVQRIMSLPNPLAGHNSWLFDEPILRNHGITIKEGTHDTLWMWHHLQPDLPAHLQGVSSLYGMPFPWKHMSGSDLDFYGCLTIDSRIPLWEGGSRKIGDIVSKQERVTIKGMDETGNIIPVNVVGWRRVSVSGQKWLKIKTEATDQALYLTPDHNVWVNGEWIKAGDLNVGDSVKIDKTGSADLIHGSLLGDGSVDFRGRLKISHSVSQSDWLDAKRSSLRGPLYEGGRNNHPMLITEVWVSQTIWRKKFYPNGRKVFVPPTYAALAIWYGDDGCLANPSTTYEGNPRVYCFYENVDEAVLWFKAHFGEEITLYRDARSPFGGAIAFNGDSKHKFWEAVAPYLHPSMERKLPPRYRGHYNGWMEKLVAQDSIITSIEPYTKRQSARYCITVDHPTHRFFAMGGLVQNCADVDAVQRIMVGLPNALSRLGLKDGYEKYVRQFRPVLAAMERRGIPVSKAKLEELRSWLTVEVTRMDSELQPLIPSSLKGKKYWKTWPADTKLMVAEVKGEKIADITNQLIRDNVRVTKKALNVVVKPSHFDAEQRKRLTDSFGYEWEGDLLYKELDFNPRSSQQILQYLKAKGYPVPKRFKDGVDTTSDKELERLEVKTKDEVLKLVRSIRAYGKMGNAYAGKLLEDGTIEGGWQPGPDGRLRATLTYGPATGQIAARNPNVMTGPKRRKELAKKFRECIVAEDGHMLVELDYRAFHARTLGLAARCKDYMRLSDLDIHSFVAGHMIHYPGIETALQMSDADLKAYLKEIKSKHEDVRNFKAKAAILGIGFRMSARRLFFENRDNFTGEAEAKRLVDLLKALFPKVFKYQDDICEEADRTGRLINSFGACRWFFDVKKWTLKDGRWVSGFGRDAEKCVAYLPSSNAHFMLRDKLLQMNDLGWLDTYGLLMPIHDAILFHCPTKLVDECVANVKGMMEAPCLQLAHNEVAKEGFTCAAEAMVGSDWSVMKEVK